MQRLKIIIVALLSILAIGALAASASAQSLGAKPKKDEWCRKESCPANPPCVFKTVAKKKTWDLKCSGKIEIEGKKQKYKEEHSGTYTVNGETYTFTETKGSAQGAPSEPGLVLVGVKTSTGWNSAATPGTYTLSTVPGYTEGWWVDTN